MMIPSNIKSSTEENKRCALYVRCSSGEMKKKGYSPQIQEEKIKEFVEANKKWTLDKKHIYKKDLGYSGGIEERPDFQRLLTAAKNKEFDIILVFRLDRFFRNLRLLENFLIELLDSGVGVKSVSEPWADYSNPSSKLSVQILGAVAEWQRGITMDAQKEGIRKAALAGTWVAGGINPLGYSFDPKTKKLKKNLKEAKLVKKIFEWFVNEKLTVHKLQKKINEMKIPTKYDNLKKEKKTKSKRWWNRTTVHRILSNPLYTGEYYWKKYKYYPGQKGKRTLRPKEDWLLLKVPPIISENLFKKAQKQLRKNKELAPKSTGTFYAFKHKLICGLCGRRYICTSRAPRTPGGRRRNLCVCSGRRHFLSPKKCVAPEIAESRILPPVWENLKKLLSRPEIVMKSLDRFKSEKDKRPTIQKHLDRIEKLLENLEKKKGRYAELYAEGSIEKRFYDEKIGEYCVEKEKLFKKKGKLQQSFISETEMKNRITSIQELYEDMKEKLENTSYETKTEAIQRLIEKIVVNGNALEIEYMLPRKKQVIKINNNVPTIHSGGIKRKNCCSD